MNEVRNVIRERLGLSRFMFICLDRSAAVLLCYLYLSPMPWDQSLWRDR